MRVCQFRHFGNEMRQRRARRRDGNYSLIVTGMPGVSNEAVPFWNINTGIFRGKLLYIFAPWWTSSILFLRKDRDMTNQSDRVLGRKGARNLSNEELQRVSGGTTVLTQFHNRPDVLGDT